MMKRKMWYTTALTSICISVLTAVQVYASDITSVSVTLKKDKEVEAGVLYPVEITVSDYTNYELSDYEWSRPYEDWEAGKKVTASVQLSIKDKYLDDYSFRKISAYCSGGKVLSAKGTGDTATVKIEYIPSLKLKAPESAYWDPQDDGFAKWERVQGADSYRVEILVYDDENGTWRNKGTKTVTKNKCDLTEYLINYQDKEVSFQVQAIGDPDFTTKSDFVLCEDEAVLEDTSIYGKIDLLENGIKARDEDGNPITGWQQVLGNWCYFNEKGITVTGWQQIGNWYYFDQTGKMQTGWQNINGNWYYLKSSGEMLTGWYQDGPNAEWYYFLPSGEMGRNWQYISGKWYYLNQTGKMQTGWQSINGNWYYLKPSGEMQTGWYQDGPNGSWYYFDQTGRMLTNTKTPDNFYVDENGRWKT